MRRAPQSGTPQSLSDPEMFLLEMFSSRSAREGGVVRRRKSSLERYVGLDRLRAVCDARGFRAVENAGHILIFCNAEPITRFAGFRAEADGNAPRSTAPSRSLLDRIAGILPGRSATRTHGSAARSDTLRSPGPDLRSPP